MRAAYYVGSRSISVADCRPVAPGPEEVQLQVSHCGICGTDLHLFHGHMNHRVATPQVIGHESSGTIAAVGERVQNWKVGQRVTVRPLAPCGQCPTCRKGFGHVCPQLKFIGIDQPGGMQSHWTVPAHTLHAIPEGLGLREAALLEPIAVACHDVRLAKVQPGEFAVVIGGGPIGALVALVAKQAGAQVVVTEINPFRIQLLRQMGLEVVDPRTTEVKELVWSRTEQSGADVVFEVSGSLPGAELMTQLPAVRGRIIIVAVFPKPVPVNLHALFWREIQVQGTRVYEAEDFDAAIALLENPAIPFRQLITGVYSLDQVQLGLEQMEAGADVMKILVDCQS